jgi:hypothetical protein
VPCPAIHGPGSHLTASRRAARISQMTGRAGTHLLSCLEAGELCMHYGACRVWQTMHRGPGRDGAV